MEVIWWTFFQIFVFILGVLGQRPLNPEVLKCHEDLITLDTYVQQGKTMDNKAIRDGKYLARHMPVLGNVHPIKIENFDIFSWRHFSARSSCYWGRQSCRPLNRVPSLPSLMVLRLTPRYVALWVENPFSRTSARTTYRLGEANFHTSLEEEGIFSRHVVLISIIVYLSCNTYNIICFFIHYNN